MGGSELNRLLSSFKLNSLVSVFISLNINLSCATIAINYNILLIACDFKLL